MEKVKVGNTGFDLLVCIGFHIQPDSLQVLKQRTKDGKLPNGAQATIANNGTVLIKETEFELRHFYSNLTKSFHTLMTIHAARVDGNNIRNMSIADVWAKIRKAEQVLYQKYGLLVNEGQLEVHSAEVNRTFVPADEIQAYKRVFQLIALVVLMNGGKKYDVSVESLKNVFSQQGLLLVKNTYSYRIYDKAAQMAEEMGGISFDKHLMRVEIMYRTKQTIKTDFKTLNLSGITDEAVEDAFNKRMRQIQTAVMNYLNQKLQYNPGFVGRDNTVPNMVAEHHEWGDAISALSSYEANYGVPCMLDSRDMWFALNNLVSTGILAGRSQQKYYEDYLKTYQAIPEAVSLFDEQRELLEDFFTKVLGGEGSHETVKMKN